MSWEKALDEAKLPDGAREVVNYNGRAVLLLRQGDVIRAVDNACPHMRFPLKGGQIHDGAIVCPFHHSAFDLDSGDVKEWSPWPPGLGPVLASLSRKKVLRTYEVKIEDGAIFIRPRLSGESGMVI